MVYRLLDMIDKLETAHTPDETFIHWTMTKYLIPNQSYNRTSYANRETKERYNEIVTAKLEKLDELKDLKLEHMKDLELP